MSITVFNYGGSGRAENLTVNPGETLDTFLNRHLGSTERAKFAVKVNGVDQTGSYPLCDGDRISLSPVNIKAAA